MFIISLVLLAIWLVAVGFLHVTGNLVHLLLITALFSFGWHLRDKARLRTSAANHRPRR